MKKWNWSSFVFIMILVSLGLLGNKSVNDVCTFFIGLVAFGIPLGLLFAWMGKED